ncbi:MAG: hypothetical protein J6386_10930 [Candidatus Synoicihabitans palmerolidicus]|nr:hypothetical protein [Candidatus Synoicihabitans palmerolidicus]
MIDERLRWMRTQLHRLFRRGQQEADLDAELQFHLDALTTQFIAEGMTERDARLAARREFGSGDTYREERVARGALSRSPTCGATSATPLAHCAAVRAFRSRQWLSSPSASAPPPPWSVSCKL